MTRKPGNLYVKYTDSDDGSDAIPAGEVFWASPSIWLTDPAGNSIPSAVVGVDNWVHVQVDSVSTEPRSRVLVQVWVCNYTAGSIGPKAAQKSSGEKNGLTTIVLSDVSNTTPGTAHVVWRPDATDLINGPNPDTGHLCVGANVYAETSPLDGSRIATGYLDVIGNRHHGWKNITVIRATGKGPAPIAFRLPNPGAEPDVFVVTAWELDSDAAMGRVEQEHLLAAGFVDLVDGAPEPPPVPAACLREPRERTRLAQGGQLVLRGMPDTTPLRPAEQRARFALVTADGRDHEAMEVGIRPGEQVPVIFEVDTAGEPGEVHTFDIVQQTRDGLVLGGARLITVDVPEWHCC